MSLRSISLALLVSLAASLAIFAGAACSKQSPTSEPAPPPTTEPTAPPTAEPTAPPTPTEPTTTVDAGALGGGKESGPLADCDVSKVRCRRMPPQCAEGQVATVSGSCFGECVAIERCACSASVACPQTDKYACWQQTHCGPYVR